MSTTQDMLVKPISLEARSQAEERLDLGEVYLRHAHDVMRWATRLSGRAQDAGDITQEVFCVVQRKPFTPRTGSLTTWLFRITEHVVRARRRKEKVYAFFFGERRLPEDTPEDQRGPLEALTARRDTALVYQALDSLSEGDRTVLVLFELEGLSGEEVAGLLDLKLATVWVRLHRARKRLSARLRELDPEVSE